MKGHLLGVQPHQVGARRHAPQQLQRSGGDHDEKPTATVPGGTAFEVARHTIARRGGTRLFGVPAELGDGHGGPN